MVEGIFYPYRTGIGYRTAGSWLSAIRKSVRDMELMWSPGLVAGPVVVAVAVTEFVRPAPNAQCFVDAQRATAGREVR